MSKVISIYLPDELLKTIKDTKEDRQSVSNRVEDLIRKGLSSELEDKSPDRILGILFGATKKLADYNSKGYVRIVTPVTEQPKQVKPKPQLNNTGEADL